MLESEATSPVDNMEPSVPPPSGLTHRVRQLTSFRAEWWFPLLVASLSATNTFVLVLSPVLTPCFLAAALARKSLGGRVLVAVMNAIGVAIGVAALVRIGKESELFQGFKPDDWVKTQEMVNEYGTLGVFLVSALPIILHPMVFFAIIMELDGARIVAAVLFGRILKYVVMSEAAHAGSSFLSLFGSAASNAVIEMENKEKTS